ncbi:MAG: hypothetical protein QOF78_6 [Phycisphaerales bacterium]|jgi:Ca2+-binding RTX toxin-like protein|nr:hypothetical protein [Phycisphaerales bacterium]
MLNCERLESRVLFALTIDLADGAVLPFHVTSKGTLVVGGTRTGDFADTIHLRVAGSGAVTLDWNKLLGFELTNVKRIYVDMGSGDDRILVSTNARTPVAVLGGGGNDRIVVTGGPATLLGGNGHDVLIGEGRYSMTFSGGRGNDRLFGSAGPDHFIGGAGSDYAEIVHSGVDGAEGVETVQIVA